MLTGIETTIRAEAEKRAKENLKEFYKKLNLAITTLSPPDWAHCLAMFYGIATVLIGGQFRNPENNEFIPDSLINYHINQISREIVELTNKEKK